VVEWLSGWWLNSARLPSAVRRYQPLNHMTTQPLLAPHSFSFLKKNSPFVESPPLMFASTAYPRAASYSLSSIR